MIIQNQHWVHIQGNRQIQSLNYFIANNVKERQSPLKISVELYQTKISSFAPVSVLESIMDAQNELDWKKLQLLLRLKMILLHLKIFQDTSFF